MNSWIAHLPVLPVVVPLMAGAAMLLFVEAQRRERTIIAFAATLANLIVAGMLAYAAGGWVPDIWPEGIAVYLVGGWQAPFGIVLVVDRLSAVMLILTAVLALTSLIYAQARWKKMGPHFQTLFQLLIKTAGRNRRCMGAQNRVNICLGRGKGFSGPTQIIHRGPGARHQRNAQQQ